MIKFPALGWISAPPPCDRKSEKKLTKYQRCHLVQVFQDLGSDLFPGKPEMIKVSNKADEQRTIFVNHKASLWKTTRDG